MQNRYTYFLPEILLQIKDAHMRHLLSRSFHRKFWSTILSLHFQTVCNSSLDAPFNQFSSFSIFYSFQKHSQANISLTVGWCSPIKIEYFKLLWKHQIYESVVIIGFHQSTIHDQHIKYISIIPVFHYSSMIEYRTIRSVFFRKTEFDIIIVFTFL